MPDQPTALERTALLVGLLRRLVETAPVHDADPARRGDYAQNRWAAARFGLDAELIHPEGDRVATARELARELLGEEPPEPEAARQLEVGPERAAADLVERTVRSV
jgi:gamma-glutamyl:cysteine ligase YbdK (ATP-grasp superfamily)